MKCKHCGADNFNESKFCFQCGQELSSDDVQHSEDPPVDPTHPICKNCGASNTADAKFCHQCGQELSSKAEDPEQKSDDDLGKDALAFGAGLLDESAAKTRNDTVCPFCGEPACHPLQKNETTVTNKSYGWGSGCCGMLLLGPFGLLCGLCGKGSKVESKSELWWVCKKCGKAHIALADALKKWEIATDGIYGSAVAAAIVLIVAKYLFSFGMLEQVAQNSVQITTPMTSGLLTYDTEFGALDLPFLFASSDQAIAAMNGEVGEYFKSTLDSSTGLTIAGYYYNGARSMTNNVRPITCVDDMKGLKMRVMNSDTYVKLMQALGANPTPISWNELFTAMQQGTVDGEENPPSTIYPSGFAEVQKYFNKTEHVFGYAAVVVSSAFYNGMDDASRKLFDEGIELLTSTADRAELELGDGYIAKMAEAGMECNDITPENKQGFIDATASVRDEYRSVYSAELWGILDKVTAN